MKRHVLCLSFLASFSLAVAGTNQLSNPMKPGQQTPQKFSVERKQVLAADYILYLPDGYSATNHQRWPLILFLHGAGERGDDVWKAVISSPPKVEEARQFIVVSPLCPSGESWSDEVLLALLDDIETRYAVDTKRVYLTGLSMGGYGTWNLAMNHPDRFAAIAPICGGGETIPIVLAEHYAPERLAQIKSLGIWAFHGGLDNVVPPEESVRMVNALKKVGCTDVKLTIYPDAYHDSWTKTYANPELFAWFLRHTR